MSDPDPTAMARFAARCEDDPDGFFLAVQLAAYRDREGVTDEDLAERLGTDAAGLVRLKLCRTPGTETQFQQVCCLIGPAGKGVLRGILGM